MAVRHKRAGVPPVVIARRRAAFASLAREAAARSRALAKTIGTTDHMAAIDAWTAACRRMDSAERALVRRLV